MNLLIHWAPLFAAYHNLDKQRGRLAIEWFRKKLENPEIKIFDAFYLGPDLPSVQWLFGFYCIATKDLDNCIDFYNKVRKFAETDYDSVVSRTPVNGRKELILAFSKVFEAVLANNNASAAMSFEGGVERIFHARLGLKFLTQPFPKEILELYLSEQ